MGPRGLLGDFSKTLGALSGHTGLLPLLGFGALMGGAVRGEDWLLECFFWSVCWELLGDVYM